MAVHNVPDRVRVYVGRHRRVPDPVLHQHGDRTLHPGDRGDRDHGLRPLLEAVVVVVHHLRNVPELLARLGYRRLDDALLHLRLRWKRHNLPHGCGPDRYRHSPHHLAGGLPDGGEGSGRDGHHHYGLRVHSGLYRYHGRSLGRARHRGRRRRLASR